MVPLREVITPLRGQNARLLDEFLKNQPPSPSPPEEINKPHLFALSLMRKCIQTRVFAFRLEHN